MKFGNKYSLHCVVEPKIKNQNIYFMRKKTFTLLAVFLFTVSGIYAQTTVSSGSIQLVSQRSEVFHLEIGGLLSFRESVTGGVLLSNLLPGEYRVRISGAQSGRRNTSLIADKVVQVLPGQRIIINIASGNRVSVNSVLDVNSVQLCVVWHGSFFAQPISEADLSRLLNELNSNRYPFDRDRLALLEVSATHHFFTSEQLGRIMTVFTSDDVRLQSAQLLIPQVVDPQNLYLQARVFTFSSSRNAFLNLIRTR